MAQVLLLVRHNMPRAPAKTLCLVCSACLLFHATASAQSQQQRRDVTRGEGVTQLKKKPHLLDTAVRFLKRDLLRDSAPGFRDAFIEALTAPNRSGVDVAKELARIVEEHPQEPERIRMAYKGRRNAGLFWKLRALVPIPGSYLDIGTGDGLLASQLAREWGLSKDRSYAIDVVRCGKQQDNLTYLQYGKHDRIPLEDNSVELATMTMVLHHASNPKGLLREAFRVLKPGGRLVIRDSDVRTEDARHQNMGLDALFSIAFKEVDDYPLAYGYRSAPKWSKTFKACGFKQELTGGFGGDDLSPFYPYHWVLQKP